MPGVLIAALVGWLAFGRWFAQSAKYLATFFVVWLVSELALLVATGNPPGFIAMFVLTWGIVVTAVSLLARQRFQARGN